MIIPISQIYVFNRLECVKEMIKTLKNTVIAV